MQIVIDIPDYVYCDIQAYKTIFSDKIEEVAKAIKYGTPLPKGHGALIDISNIDVIELEDSIHFIRHEKGDDVDVYIGAPIIIKANRESEG